MENTLTIAELKRRGAAALEQGLKHGPIHVIKRNKTAAIVLSEAQYEQLRAARESRLPGLTAMQWLLEHPGPGTLPKKAIDRRLREERDW